MWGEFRNLKTAQDGQIPRLNRHADFGDPVKPDSGKPITAAGARRPMLAFALGSFAHPKISLSSKASIEFIPKLLTKRHHTSASAQMPTSLDFVIA
jgi:hypothetical protein